MTCSKYSSVRCRWPAHAWAGPSCRHTATCHLHVSCLEFVTLRESPHQKKREAGPHPLLSVESSAAQWKVSDPSSRAGTLRATALPFAWRQRAMSGPSGNVCEVRAEPAARVAFQEGARLPSRGLRSAARAIEDSGSTSRAAAFRRQRGGLGPMRLVKDLANLTKILVPNADPLVWSLLAHACGRHCGH